MGMGTDFFDWMVGGKGFKWSRLVRQFVRAGRYDFCYVVIKREAMQKDIDRVLKKMQTYSLMTYGDTKYAFKSSLWAGKKGKCVLMFVPPSKYVDDKMGCMGSIDNIIRAFNAHVADGRAIKMENTANKNKSKSKSK
jgi:hypothetical protein